MSDEDTDEEEQTCATNECAVTVNLAYSISGYVSTNKEEKGQLELSASLLVWNGDGDGWAETGSQ